MENEINANAVFNLTGVEVEVEAELGTHQVVIFCHKMNARINKVIR